MIDLVNYINEGNISNVERKYREFKQLCSGYNVDITEVCVKQTSKHNWIVYQNGKRKFLVSNNILNQAVIDTYQIPTCE